MNCSYKTLLTVWAVLLSMLYGHSQERYCPYFPLEQGKKWQYISADFPDTLISMVTDTSRINERLYYHYSRYYFSPSSQMGYWLRPEADKILALNLVDSTEYLLFDFNAQPNQSWDIPPDSALYHVAVNQCEWGTSVSFVGVDSVINPNRRFLHGYHFNHLDHPCMDAGLVVTYFVQDFGLVRFSEVTEGGVLDWDLICDTPDTLKLYGRYGLIGNPCLTEPCLPGVVSVIQSGNQPYVLAHEDHWYWNDDFSWNGLKPQMGDSIKVRGVITDRKDINGKSYRTVDIYDFQILNQTAIREPGFQSQVDRFSITRVYPNPFNQTTTVVYSLHQPAMVHLALFDVNGRLVKKVLDGFQNAGSHSVALDGGVLATGVYYLRLRIMDEVIAEKILMIK